MCVVACRLVCFCHTKYSQLLHGTMARTKHFNKTQGLLLRFKNNRTDIMNGGYVSTCFNHNLPTFHFPSSSHLLEKPQWHSPAGDALIERAVAVVGEPMAGAVATAGAAQGKIGMGQNSIPWGLLDLDFFSSWLVLNIHLWPLIQ